MPLTVIQASPDIGRIMASFAAAPEVPLDLATGFAGQHIAPVRSGVPILVGQPSDVIVLCVHSVLAPPGKGEIAGRAEVQVVGASQRNVVPGWKLGNWGTARGLKRHADDARDVRRV